MKNIFVKLLSPFAPHLAEELWSAIGETDFLSVSAWPTYDESKLLDATVEIGVQVNGKVKAVVAIPVDCDKDTALSTAKADPKIAEAIADKQIVKEIYVPNKIINIVVR